VKSLAAVWRSLPSTSKTKVSGRRTRTNKAISKSKSATKITLSDNDKQYLVSWKAAPSTFFQRHEEFQFHLQEDPLAQVYNSLSALDKIDTVNRIQRRILLVVIHRLKKKVCCRFHGEAVNHIALKIFQSGLVKENHDSILRKLTSWAKAGARYDTLARNLEGLGALALLPGDIGTTM